MVNRNFFDGGLVCGPAEFVKATGRDKIFASQPGTVISIQKRPCPLCGVDKPEHLFDVIRDNINHWDYARCPGCGMIYTVKAPTESELRRVYESAPAQQAWVKLQQNSLELQMDRAKFQWALEQIGWPFGKRAILDIGCSTGTLLEVANAMGENVDMYGIEINPEAREVASARLRDKDWPRGRRLGAFITDGFEVHRNGTLDLVVLWEVLEHVLEPQKMLQQAMDLVAPGGYLMLCVPNADALAAKILHEKASCFGLGHLNFYSPFTLAKAIRLAHPHPCPVRQETIVSWSRELANWMNFQEPMAGNEPVHEMFTPEEIHRRLMGYKLVAWVKKET